MEGQFQSSTSWKLPIEALEQNKYENIGSQTENQHPPLLNRMGSFSIIANQMKSFVIAAPVEKKLNPFLDWTRVQLIALLISDGEELRYERHMSYSNLRERAEKLYLDRSFPEKPPTLSRNEIRIRNEKAQLIQNVWIQYQYALQSSCIFGSLDRTPSGILPIDSVSQRNLSELTSAVEDEIDYESETFVGFYKGLYDDIAVDKEPSSRNLQRQASNISVMEYLEVAELNAHEHDNSFSAVVMAEIEADSAMDDPDIELGIPTNSYFRQGSVNFPSALDESKKTIHFLDQPWTPPDWVKSVRYADFFHPRRDRGKESSLYSFSNTTTGRHCCLGLLGEQCDYFREGQMSELALYGPGVTNYFKFLKWCIWLFFTLSLITIIQTIINSNGAGYLSHQGLSHLAVTTVGNLDFTASNSTYLVSVALCEGFNLDHTACEPKKSQLGELYSAIDIIVSIVVLMAFLWLRKFQYKEEQDLDKNTIYASQYTVMVRNLPHFVTEKDIYCHFYSLLNQDNSSYEGFPIAAVQLAVENEHDIKNCIIRGELINTKKRLINQHRFSCTLLREKYIDNPFLAEEEIRLLRFQFSEVCKDLDEQIKDKSDSICKLNSTVGRTGPVSAFVTFDHEIAAILLMQQYNNMPILKYYFSHDHPFRWDGRLLKLSQAPEPSTIIWENMKYCNWSKLWRRVLTTLLALALIFISTAITIACKAYQQENLSSTDAGMACTAAFQQLPRSEQLARVETDSSLTNCYCGQFSDSVSTDDPLCTEYVKNRLYQQLFTFFASITVIVINLLLDLVIKHFSKFEKHFSENTQENYTLIRVFFLKYMNTAGVFLINNNAAILNDIFQVEPTSTLEFSSDWYSNTGVSILLVQIGNVFSTHLYKIFKFYLHKRSLRIAHENLTNKFDGNKNLVFTQEDLNEMQKGSPFQLAYRYAQLLSTFFVCMTFSSGMPALYIIGGANFLVFYIVEKFLFIKYYQNPPRFNTRMNKTVADLIPLAVFLHLGMAVWMLSNKQFFSNSLPTTSSDSEVLSDATNAINLKSVNEKISQSHTFPLFVFALTLGIIIAFQGFMEGPFRILFKITKGFFIKPEYESEEGTCGCLSIQEKQFESLVKQRVQLVTFRNAMKRNLMKGLATYNILQNPNYKQAFGISWKFAVEYRHIHSLVQVKLSHDDEDDLDHAQHLMQVKYSKAYALAADAFKREKSTAGPNNAFYKYSDPSAKFSAYHINMLQSNDGVGVQMPNLYAPAADEDIVIINDVLKRDGRSNTTRSTVAFHRKSDFTLNSSSINSRPHVKKSIDDIKHSNQSATEATTYKSLRSNQSSQEVMMSLNFDSSDSDCASDSGYSSGVLTPSYSSLAISCVAIKLIN